MTNTILRLPAVKTLTGLSRSTIYLRMADGTFPKAVSLGGKNCRLDRLGHRCLDIPPDRAGAQAGGRSDHLPGKRRGGA